MKKTNKKVLIAKITFLVIYIICVGVLIIESCMDGPSSASQSNAVGGGIAHIINSAKGDQTVAVTPTNVRINNEKTSFKTGESVQLEIQTTPSNSTYQSYNYTSSNTTIAKVSDDGLVKFISEGTVSITCINDKYSKITDTIIFNVEDIDVTNITASISNLKPSSNDVYELTIGQSYPISSSLSPTNATNKKIKYSIPDQEYISINNNGIIKALNETSTPIEIELETSNDEVYTKIKVIVKPVTPPFYELESIKCQKDSYSIVQTQSIKPNIIFTPTNATYQEYTLSTSDSSIVSINGKSIIGKGVGTATITATSTEYENISCTFTVNVEEQPLASKYKVSTTTTLVEGATKNISVTANPSHHKILSKSFSSSNTNIVTVTNSGKMTAIAPGTATITVSANDLEPTILTITVTAKPEEDKTGDFEIEFLKGKNPLIYTNKEINLTEYFTINKWFDTSGNDYNPQNKSFTYSLIDSESASLSNNNLTITKPGKVSIAISHVVSETTKTVDIIAINHFDIMVNDQIYNNELVSEYVTKTIALEIIEDKLSSISQGYTIKINNKNASYNKNGNLKYQIQALQAGNSTITITPAIEGVDSSLLSSISKTFNIKLNHILAKGINTTATITHHDNTKETINLEDKLIEIYLNDKINLKSVITNKATISEINYSSSNEEIFKVTNTGVITPNKTGTAKIIISEPNSNLEYDYTITICNLIEVVKENPITVKGFEASYDSDNNIYTITNGYASSIKLAFEKYSTYTKVNYTSSNEDVLTVGKDGTITTNKSGTSTITITCDDGLKESDTITYEVNVKVKKQPAIKDMSTFLGKIRKGLGHFGAFLVLGIFSTLTYLLFFKNKHWFWSVPVNFAQGFFVAALTEYIQTFIPGRYGAFSDIMIDFSGFLSSSIIITIIILAIPLTKYIIKKYKENKNKSIKEE